MKKEYLQILEREISDHKHKKNDILEFANSLIDFYESNRATTSLQFTKLLEKFSFEFMSTIHKNSIPHVELFHGSGGLEFIGSVDGAFADDIGVIIPEPPYDLQYHAPRLEKIENHTADIQHQILFIWMCTIWQEIKGHQYGTVVKTLENNSIRQFFFNDFAWNRLSEFYDYKDRERKIPVIFNRDLTLLEIYQRVNFKSYPVNPYQNKWRKFIKGNETIEIGTWANSVVTRTNTNESAFTDKKDLEERMVWEMAKYNELLNDGFTEVDFKTHKEKIHEDAIEFTFHSGTGWYKKELENRLDESSIAELENALNIKLPYFFKQYLKLFNGRKFNKYRTKFIINENEFLKINEFYNKDEIIQNNINNTSINWLKVAVSDRGEVLIGVTAANNRAIQILNEDGSSIELGIKFDELMNRMAH